MKLLPGFNVRSYGVLLSSDSTEVLLVDEEIEGRRLLKFPGGGIEMAEGPGDALKREFLEELDLAVNILEAFYVSPHFHLSFFRPQQFIGLYWSLKLATTNAVPKSQNSNLKVVWRRLKDLDPNEMTHAMDREVIQKLIGRLSVKSGNT